MRGLLLIMAWIVVSGVAAGVVLTKRFGPASSEHFRLCLWEQSSTDHDEALARARRAFLPLVALQASTCVAQLTLVGYGRHVGGSLWAFYLFGSCGLVLTGFYVWVWHSYAGRLVCVDHEALEREITAKVHGMIERMTQARAQWRSN